MDIADKIAQEHSKQNTKAIADFIGTDASQFKILLDIFIGEDYRMVQRSSWIVSTIAEAHPNFVRPYLPVLVKQLHQPKHEAVKRNILRLLQFVDIPPALHEDLINICFDTLANTKEPIAIRVFAMTVLEKITRELPELQNELSIILEDQMPYGSAGFRSRAKKILQKIKASG